MVQCNLIEVIPDLTAKLNPELVYDLTKSLLRQMREESYSVKDITASCRFPS